MLVHVAFAVHEVLGAHVLGVSPIQDKAKKLCLAHHELQEVVGALEWHSYFGEDGTGVQAIQPGGDRCYYVEETGLEIQTRADDPETGLTWEARQILNLTIANGQLAQQNQQVYAMVKPLQARERILERYINYLFAWLKRLNIEFDQNSFEFKLGHSLPDELWDIQDWEVDVDSNLDTPGRG